MSKILNAFAILLLSSQSILAAPSIFVDSPEDAFALSEETKLKVLLIFSADWCAYCNILKDNINGDPDMIPDTIICFIDYDKRKDMVKQYKVKTIPDSLLYKDKKEIKRKVGFKNKQDYIDWLNK